MHQGVQSSSFELAGIGMQVIVFGGHSAESGWFTRRHEVYHDDLVVLERQGTIAWHRPPVSGFAPPAREYHTLTAVGPDRLLLLGGKPSHATMSQLLLHHSNLHFLEPLGFILFKTSTASCSLLWNTRS